MQDLNELELAAVVGGFTINHDSNNFTVNVTATANLSTTIHNGKITGGSAVSSGNSVVQNSTVLPLF